MRFSDRTGPFWDGVAGRVPVPPAAVTLGFEFLCADPDEGTIEIAFRATESFTNPMGEVLGGFLATMLFDTVGPALLATLEPHEFQNTLELKTSFHRAVRPGRFVGRGRIVHRAGDLAFLEASLNDDAGIVASATATAQVTARGARRPGGADRMK
jgi:uncharacterized protein (TIGR00369 family)